MKLTKLAQIFTSGAIALSLCGCGSDSNPVVNLPPVVTVPPVVTAPPPVGQQLQLDTAIEHITINEPAQYYIELAEDAETLVISFAKGAAGKSLGDPDLYIKLDDTTTLDNYRCASLRGEGTNEVCIIDKPQAGVYQILVDPFLQPDAADNTVTDATLWASTTLLTSNQSCNEGLIIRGQAMSQSDLDDACVTINQTQDVFHHAFSNISPAPLDPVSGDRNEVTGLTIFASLSNHEIWMPYLHNSDNRSGIYYETDPASDFHKSEIFTFNALEWTRGLTVYRSLAHEYIHALDGRFNKEGGYKESLGWWSEGLAEYLSYATPYDRFETSIEQTQFTLSDIFQTHNNGYNASPYTWGTLAVAFLMQEHPQEVTNMLGLMRGGQWDEWDALLVTLADTYQAEFAVWVTTGPREDFENSAKPLALEDYALVEGRGGWLYSVEVPEGTDSLTISMTGGSTNSGSMDVDMMVSASQVAHWSFGVAPQCAPYAEGNEEVCTFTDVTPGTYYITLDEHHSWAADIVDVYLSACAGDDCAVTLPESKPLVEAIDYQLPVEPIPTEATLLPISGCDLVAPYTRTSDDAIINVTNTTDTPVTLYWVNNNSGEANLTNAYATLAQGESYTADFWAVGDRMMLADSNDSCLGVADLSTPNNQFTIEDSLFNP